MTLTSMKTTPVLYKDDKSIYVLLMRSSTIFSRIIGLFTRSRYTHASLGLNSDCQEFYSFARRFAHLPLPAGFVKENVSRGLMGKHPAMPCALYTMSISSDAYNKMCSELSNMSLRQNKLKYSIKGSIFCFFSFPAEFEDQYFCSQFVAQMLQDSGAMDLQKPASLYKPCDLIKHAELSLCYEGPIGGLTHAFA